MPWWCTMREGNSALRTAMQATISLRNAVPHAPWSTPGLTWSRALLWPLEDLLISALVDELGDEVRRHA
jgi:hypothetical protein